uniref:Putative salivary lipocalin n=1 Tax=Ixodes ricinus TaxID=34613 RepID=A0A0K8RMM4_IXORI
MKSSSSLFSIFLNYCCSITRKVMANDGTQVDNHQYCESHQDINRALQNCDPFSWMYYRTYQPNLTDPEYACVYANVTKLNGTGKYMFMQGWTQANNKTIEVPLFVSTEKTPGYKGIEDNAMRVTLKAPNKTVDFGLYELIYSDYEKCDILRVMSRGQACEMYVHSRFLDEKQLTSCISIYKQACVKEGSTNYVVYNENCQIHRKANFAATAMSQ